MLRRAFQVLRRRGQAALAPYPAAYFMIERLTRPPGYSGSLCRETELVIEGFPGSANSWSVVAFREAQPRPLRIAHHRHAEAQVLAGAARGLPVLVLVRRPEDAIRSLVSRYPDHDPGQSLDRWLAFYRAVDRVRDRVVIATFEQATQDLASVVERLNARFGTSFLSPSASEEYRAHVFKALARDNAANPRFGALPDARRVAAVKPLAFAPDKLQQAHALYAELERHASPFPASRT